MQRYLVESYSAGGAAEAQCELARLAAARRAGIQYIRTTFLPGDETLLHVFEATSPEVLREAAGDVALAYERIVEVVEGSVGSPAATERVQSVEGSTESREGFR
jgi:hypothetical protein